MKIFIISQGVPSGSAPLNGIFAWDQALALKKLGHEVSVMALDFRRVFDRRFGKQYFKKDGINVYQYSLHTGIYRRFLHILGRVCAKVYRDMVKEQGEPDVVHSHFYFMGAILASMPKRPACPVVITEHSSKLNKDASLISKLDKKLARMAYDYADRVVAVSNALAKRLKTNFSVDAEVIPDMFNLPKVEPVAKDDNVFRVVSVGRIVRGKGFFKLVNAFYQAQIPENSELIIIGDGPLKEFIQEGLVNHRTRLVGMKSREEIVRYLQSADMFALLSQSETFGVSCIEALSVGLPVLVTRCGGPEDFINESNGMLVPVGDMEEAGVAISKMYLKKYDKEAIKKDCYEKYSPDAVARRLVEYYASIS
ncbi:MAG: glycosyltransferase [Paludibacteraceae bacterium]|nr:glycosyltransferase [Paludibacteraceae bacterium]